MPSSPPFNQFQADLQRGGVDAALARLADWFKGEQRYHDLFDTRLMQARVRLGLPIILTTPLEDLPEPLRTEVENAYLAACRESGWLLWEERKIREAWMYLRALGDNAAVAAALAKIEPDEENLAELIELALHEGVAPARGMEWVLSHYGTCNAITAFDTEIGRFRRPQQQAAAALIVRRLHDELLSNVRADIVRREDKQPSETTLADLVASRDWLFADNNYQIDTSHLSAAVRFARIVEDPAVLQLAWELTEYGRRLGATFQLAGDEPFGDVHVSHGLFFAAQLGRQVDEALAYFRAKAEQAVPETEGNAAAETYVVLLVRLRRFAEALAAHTELIPPTVRISGFAPSLLEVGRLAEDYQRLIEVCREREDLLGFAAGMISAKAESAKLPANSSALKPLAPSR